MKATAPILQRRLIGIPACLIALIAVIGLIALAFVPSPTWTPRSFRLQAFVTQLPDGSFHVTDLAEVNRLVQNGGRLIAEIYHTQEQVFVIAEIHHTQELVRFESGRWWPTYEHDCFQTLITPRGQSPSTTQLMTEADELWTPVSEYIARANPAQSAPIVANGYSAQRHWAPGELQNRLTLARWTLWLVLGVSVLRFVIPLPMTRKARRRALGQCLTCGYDLRGTIGPLAKCPECGTPVRSTS